MSILTFFATDCEVTVVVRLFKSKIFRLRLANFLIGYSTGIM